ncbi:DNRLRE domain-containing protein [Candidatus Bathyarchaeota archaeon]|nr:DNRLRE domain-containing protein [Candidatus Bathyarchaeota archaeon]
MKHQLTVFAFLLILFYFAIPPSLTFNEKTYIFQPCLSNNISIMRNNNHSSIEQPLTVTSGFKTDCSQPSDERGLLKFDISNLPKGFKVKLAKLHLYVIGVYVWNGVEWLPKLSLARTIQVHRIITDWVGWSFTYWDYAIFPSKLWSKSGGDFLPATASVNFEILEAWNTWIVTSDVEAWYKGESLNYGWLIKDLNEGDPVGYRVEYNNWFYVFGVEYSPKLEVTLTIEFNTLINPFLLMVSFIILGIPLTILTRNKLR